MTQLLRKIKRFEKLGVTKISVFFRNVVVSFACRPLSFFIILMFLVKLIFLRKALSKQVKEKKMQFVFLNGNSDQKRRDMKVSLSALCC